ncbi:MAG: SpoIID/LytB domain-containing protein [Clostridia bacterium]
MNIVVKMTRKANLAWYGAASAQGISLPIEEYLRGVVPSELSESSPMEALCAQAIAARTYALKRAAAGISITDTANHQAYRCDRIAKSSRSQKAVAETAGQVLGYEGKPIDCFYSSSNGGITKRSGEVWRRDYPYYVHREDAWDNAYRSERTARLSHGVGMSQVGAIWAARNGISAADILAFYYVGTALMHFE